jgi:patatin-like phospholipase/acyl hydrolase
VTVTTETDRAAERGRFQVLSLDGGGVRGIFSAALLAGLEKDLGRPVLDNFDLVVGTSTDGLIAAALGAGMVPEEIVGNWYDRSTGRTGCMRSFARCSAAGSWARAACRW